MSELPIKEVSEGVAVFVRLTPNASRDCLLETVFWNGVQLLSVQVRAVPERGKANKALINLLSKKLSVPKSRIGLVKGAKSRHKTLLLEGVSMKEIKTKLDQILK